MPKLHCFRHKMYLNFNSQNCFLLLLIKLIERTTGIPLILYPFSINIQETSTSSPDRCRYLPTHIYGESCNAQKSCFVPSICISVWKKIDNRNIDACKQQPFKTSKIFFCLFNNLNFQFVSFGHTKFHFDLHNNRNICFKILKIDSPLVALKSHFCIDES